MFTVVIFLKDGVLSPKLAPKLLRVGYTNAFQANIPGPKLNIISYNITINGQHLSWER